MASNRGGTGVEHCLSAFGRPLCGNRRAVYVSRPAAFDVHEGKRCARCEAKRAIQRARALGVIIR